MPYIDQDRREKVCLHGPIYSGELNYAITRLLRDYINVNPGYQGINDVLGALEGAKMEFYRRVAVPYEEVAITRNGDVY